MHAAAFTEKFVAFFEARASINPTQFKHDWHSGGRAWTQTMLGPTPAGEQASILHQTVESLFPSAEYSQHHGWYTIDLLAVAPPFRDGTDYWDTSAQILIEHENGRDIETEIWKLMHWRAPLKVLIFYRHLDDEWLKGKIAFIDRRIGQDARKYGEEYLLLAGCNVNSNVQWREYIWPGAGPEYRSVSTNVAI